MDKRIAKADDLNAATDTIVATFDVHYRHYLDPKGQLIGEAPAFAKDREIMLSLYRAMTLTRIFDY
jgi:pyruvate dehydrogenase E1 component alpha subunit